MKLSFIAPTFYIKKFQAQGDFILALAHLIEADHENEYEKEIKATGLPIWLDNGVFEKGNAEGTQSLLAKAFKINAELVFAPDTFYDKEATIFSLDAFLYNMKSLNLKFKIGAIIQADTLEDYLKIFDKFNNDKRVDVIGINHLTTGLVMQKEKYRPTKKELKNYQIKKAELEKNRIDFLKLIAERNPKNCHLLGLGNGYADVIFAAKNCPFVISNDTSSPVWNGFQKKQLFDDGSIEGGKTKKEVDFKMNNATSEQINLAQYNINKIKKLIKD